MQNKNFIKLLFIAILFLIVINNLKAQDKYEYGVVSCTMSTKEVKINTTLGDNVIENKFDVSINEYWVPVNKVLKDLSSQGWEVYGEFRSPTNVLTIINQYFYLRKKQ